MTPPTDPPAFLALPAKYRDVHRQMPESYGLNLAKKIYLADRLHITGDCITDHLTVGTFAERERFADSLPMSICYEGRNGLNEAFRAWLKEEKTRK